MTTTDPAPWVTMFAGVRRRRCALGPQTYQMQVELDQDAHVPLHQHPHEQVSYIISGRLRFQLGEELSEHGPGSALAIPGNTPHAVWALEPSFVIDTFAPVREDYLARDREG